MTEGKPECVETLRAIEAFLDGEVETTVAVRIETHIAGCPPCWEKAEFRRRLKVMISSKCSSDRLPADLREKLRQLLDDAPPS
jgi:mycothiol system anti-sigma-R factor